jgi:hypothetical protein
MSTREKSVCRLQCVTDDNKGIGLSYPAIDHRDERIIYSLRLYIQFVLPVQPLHHAEGGA